VVCSVCQTAEPVRLFDKDGYLIVRCRACGLVQVGTKPSAAELAEIYGEAYFTDDVFHDYVGEREIRLASGGDLARTLAAIVPSGRLLDIGCAAGFFLAAAREHYDVTGVELSAFASEYARNEFGLRVLTGDISEAGLDGETFDVVTLWNTIEHMPNPLGSLETAASLTEPGALLVLSTGDASGPLARRGLRDWNLMTPPHHLFFFTPRTIDELLSESGFRLRRIVYDGMVAERGVLASPRARQLATVLGLGNVMTVYAVRSSSRETPSRGRRLLARYRPLALVRR
jgi:SAM-dependent methyltransferase